MMCRNETGGSNAAHWRRAARRRRTRTDGEVTAGELVGIVRVRALRSDRGDGQIQQPATSGAALGAGAVGQEAVVTNAMRAVRQRLEEKAADELEGFEGHDLGLAAMAIILPANRTVLSSNARSRLFAMAT